MKKYELEITNELPLKFEGELLFQDDNSVFRKIKQDRYHELEIYEAVDEKEQYFIVWINFESYWQGENSVAEFFTTNNKKSILNILNEYDPVAHFVGYNEYLIDREERERKELIFNWNKLKSEALIELGFEREPGRPSVSSGPKISTTVTIDPKLKQFAIDNQIDLSQLLNDVLATVILNNEHMK